MTNDPSQLTESTADTPRRVLVTGAAGLIGVRVSQALEARGHYVRGMDRAPMSHLHDTVVADIVDADALEQAVEGMDTIVHLAATPDEREFIEYLLRPNIEGLYLVMEAARRHEVRRVVPASSVQTINGLLRNPPDGLIGTRDHQATNHYGLTKLLMEQMAEMYHRKYGLSSVVARIGWCPRERPEPEPGGKRGVGHTVYSAHRDVQQFFVRAVEAEDVGFGVFYAVGPHGKQKLDMAPGKQAIGYEPTCEFPEGLIFEEDAAGAEQSR